MTLAFRQPLRCFYLWLVLGWLFIFWVIYQSLTPSPVQTPGIVFGDKVGHFAAYFVMMAWFAQLYTRQRHFLFLICFILLGVAMEILQGQTTYRLFEFADMVANSLGAFVAYFCAAPRYRFAGILRHCECVISR